MDQPRGNGDAGIRGTAKRAEGVALPLDNVSMTLPLSSALKLDRARELIAVLKRESEAYVASGAISLDPIQRSDEPTPTWDVYLRISSPPPQAWSPIIGDVLHNARSALDTFAFDVITTRVRSLTQKEHRKIFFPIVDDPRDFDSCNWHRGLPLPPGLVTAFRWAQPWRDAEPAVADGIITPGQLTESVKYQPLRWLRDLNNHDKHQAIHTAIALLDIPWAVVPGGAGEWNVPASRPFDDGDPVGVFRVTGSTTGPPTFDGSSVVTLPIHDIEPSAVESIADQLERMCSAVETAIYFVNICLDKQDRGEPVGP